MPTRIGRTSRSTAARAPRRVLVALLVASFALALHLPGAAGQTRQRWSIQGSALFADLYGDNFFAIEGGFGAELQARFTPSAFSVGGGVQYTHHGDSQAKQDGYPGHIDLLGLFVEPRYVVYVGSQSAAPYVSVRAGFARLHLRNDLPEGELTWTSNGVSFNGGGGFLVRLGERVNLDVGATAGLTHYGDADGKLNGATFPEALGSGTNLVLRAGLAVGLG